MHAPEVSDCPALHRGHTLRVSVYTMAEHAGTKAHTYAHHRVHLFDKLAEVDDFSRKANIELRLNVPVVDASHP